MYGYPTAVMKTTNMCLPLKLIVNNFCYEKTIARLCPPYIIFMLNNLIPTQLSQRSNGKKYE